MDSDLKAPKISEVTKNILNKGSHILLPFDIGDASISFSSRWQLAKLIQDAINQK